MQNKFEQVLIRENVFLNNLNHNTLNNLNLPFSNFANNKNYNSSGRGSGTNNQYYHNKSNSNIDNLNTIVIDKSKIFNNNNQGDEKIKKNINEQLDYVI
jgi:hypothetical protein